MQRVIAFSLVLLAGCSPDFDAFSPEVSREAGVRETTTWDRYGGDGARKFAALEQINPDNVGGLELAWTYQTGDVDTVFQTTPVLADGRLLFCSPYNRVIALDPLTGGELWVFDPEIDRNMRPANEYNCRAVSPYPGDDPQCPSKLFLATNDARLIALSGTDGSRCAGFGQGGEVDLAAGVGKIDWPGEYQVTSPPAIVGNLVIVGSAVSDGRRLDAPSGVVRAYDALSGALVWAFDLAPPGFDHDTGDISSAGYALGTPNVWAPMTGDEHLDLVYLPTGNPAPDYFRSGEINMAHYGASVVALRASTGEVVWHFNTVLKDFWDFDVPAQPVLADLDLNGSRQPVLIQATKMGHIFVLNRETGEPVVPVTEQPVPRHGPLAAQLSEVQPFPPEAFQVSRTYRKGESLLGLCDAMDDDSVAGPVFTPITEDWTIGLPSNMGAINWGGVAVDEARGLMVVNTNSVPFRTRLIARSEVQDLLDVMSDAAAPIEARQAAREELFTAYELPPGTDLHVQRGVAYLMARHPYLDPTIGIPCAGPPLAELMVIDIAAQTQIWRRPHGTLRDITFLPIGWGSPGMGGSLITSTGLIFIGAAAERALRAYHLDSGEELWHHRLPFPANATPMSYTVRVDGENRQFVVVAAGGDARGGIGGEGDYLVAFSLQH